MALPKLFQRIFWHNNTTPAINEDNLNAMSKAIDDIDNRVITLGDDVITIIPQIQAYLDQAEDLVEAMELLSQNPPYIGQNGNWWVWDTNTSTFVDSGVDASISVDIADITMLAPNAEPYVTNTGTDTDPVFHLYIPRGQTGNGISTIAKTGTSGLVDTYTITMTDGTTSTFTVTNGAGDMNKSVYDPTNAIANAGGMKSAAAKNSTNAVTANSTDLVESGAVYTADKGIYEVMGQNGAKNLGKHPTVTITRNGVEYSSNDDGIINVNRTSSSSSTSYFNGNEWSSYSGYSFILEAGTYIFSTGYEHIPSTIDNIFLQNLTDGNVFLISAKNGPAQFTIDSAKEIKICIAVLSSQSPSNVKVYPMVRLASDTDDTYQPYAETNQQLTSKTDGLWDNMMDNGAVNLLENTATSQTINGITVTFNADGTVTANGTATAYVELILHDYMSAGGLKQNAYKITGCPNGGSEPTYQIFARSGSDHQTIYHDYGDGVAINDSLDWVKLNIKNGQTVSNIVFKPMISLAELNLSYDDYVPYAMSNRELTEEVTPQEVAYTINSSVVNVGPRLKLYKIGKEIVPTGYISTSAAAAQYDTLFTITNESSKDEYEYFLMVNSSGNTFLARFNSDGTVKLDSATMPKGGYIVSGTLICK